MEHQMRTSLPRFVAATLAALVAAACAINPATGQRELMMISESQEIAMGREYDPQIVAQMGLYPDSALQRYIADLGQRLAAQSERPNLPWTFRVIDDPVVNAFAVPGGFVYMTRGILAHFNSEAQLVAVLGHEIGHVTARHSAAQMSKQQLAQIGLVVGSIASERFAQFSDLAGAGLGVLFLKYGRDDENEADALGLRYMKRTAHDVREMPGVYAMLGSLSAASGAGDIPNWLSSHPTPADRQQRIERAISRIPAESLGTIVERDSYLRRLENVVYGNNPRDGFFVGQRFNHPDMRFTMVFPDGWQTRNQAQAVVAMSANRDAAIQLTLSRSASADEALRAFTSQEGLQSGPVARPAISGFASAAAPFVAVAESDTLRGTVLFVEHRGLVFQLLAYGPAASWSAQQGIAERAIRSFAVLTDRAALDIQPQRVVIVRVDRAASIDELRRRRASPLTAEELAVLNQVRVGEVLPVGRLVKWVTGPAVGVPTGAE
jgi:predicted Zn-dependent protease